MSRSLEARLAALEAADPPSEAFSIEAAQLRVAELRALGREMDETPSEFGGLFSPNQLCRMVEIVEVSLQARPTKRA